MSSVFSSFGSSFAGLISSDSHDHGDISNKKESSGAGAGRPRSNSTNSTTTKNMSSMMLPPSYEQRREDALKRLYRGVDVKNRIYHFKKYSRCFVGSEAVDFMIKSGWAKSREHAVKIGQSLQKEFNLFEHVVDPDRHLFQDDFLFFKFNKMESSFLDESISRDDSSTSNHTTSQSVEDDLLLEAERHRRTSITRSLMNDSKKIGLISVGEILRRGVNQKYNSILDKKGFYADEGVDYMVSTGLANSRSDAEAIGLALQKAAGVIQNAKMPDKPFKNSRTFFFFTDEGSVELKMPTWKKDLRAACDFFRENMKRTDHVYRLRTYKDTFTGKEGVDLFLMAGITNSRQDAVLLGRALMVEFNLFGHVVDEHEFEDADFFYKFSNNN